MENIFEISYIIKKNLFYVSWIPLRNSSKRNENVCSHKDLNVNIHSTFIILKKKQLETIQWSMNGWMDKQLWYIRVMEYYTAIKMEWPTGKHRNIKILYWDKKLQTKWIHLYETLKNHKPNLDWQKADLWGPGSEGRPRQLLRKFTIRISVVWEFLNTDYGGGDWHVDICQNSWNTCLRRVPFMYVNPISKLIENAMENYDPTASV